MVNNITGSQFKKLSRKAVWTQGNGPYALLAHCRSLTITRHPTLEAAEQSKDRIDRTGCGGACHLDHEIILVDG